MEAPSQKSLEKVVSQRALQMSSSFPCQICVVCFLCGVCLTSLFLAALTSFGTFEFGVFSFAGFSTWNSTTQMINMVTSEDCDYKAKETEGRMNSQKIDERSTDEKASLLYSVWSALLNESIVQDSEFFQRFGLNKSSVPKAPHFENCKLNTQVNKRLDARGKNGRFPPWTVWKGFLDIYPPSETDEQMRYLRRQAMSKGSYPPWITGSDEDNYPFTRKVQRDIWSHQHPSNCQDPNVRFLVADWERLPGFGMGGQIAGMCGLLAIAINEKRVLVTNYYNRADHDGCKGPHRSSWSCYFFPETSQECRDRAFELMGTKEAWENGTITGKDNYSSKEIWVGPTPRVWGNPWSYLQPTTEINGSLIAYHRKMDRRWWRAQAVRYLMRFQTEYTCGLLNVERHAAFGWEAAKMVLSGLGQKWPEDGMNKPRSDIEEFVWSNHKAWIPRPLLSLHVRMGDKACEMKLAEFEEYMRLADRIRQQFPHLNSIWLSTEMQEVIEKSNLYPHWKFYYTNVRRQVGNTTMATYEASLGREISTNYPMVNFWMAAEADFFVGALGSTWCFLIDGMRNTGGKDGMNKPRSDIEEFVWSNHKAWIPRPLLSLHVRMGDKACEMKLAEFEEYMRLADRIRQQFPHLNSIWLSTEMQEVIEKSNLYPHWKFYYTNVRRQVGNTTMATYEASLGREISTNYPMVNFWMAAEADFFVGALGSTWCFLIDGMRNTGGKVMAGYLSVNKDRFW